MARPGSGHAHPSPGTKPRSLSTAVSLGASPRTSAHRLEAGDPIAGGCRSAAGASPCKCSGFQSRRGRARIHPAQDRAPAKSASDHFSEMKWGALRCCNEALEFRCGVVRGDPRGAVTEKVLTILEGHARAARAVCESLHREHKLILWMVSDSQSYRRSRCPDHETPRRALSSAIALHRWGTPGTRRRGSAFATAPGWRVPQIARPDRSR